MTATALVAVKEHSQVDQCLKHENLQADGRLWGTRNSQLDVIIGIGLQVEPVMSHLALGEGQITHGGDRK